MGFEFLIRVRKTSVFLGLVLFPVFATHMGINFGLGWIIGIAWSLVNLHVITDLIKRIFITSKRNRLRIALVFFAKFPALYLVGYLALNSGRFPIPALLVGFIWPFFVMLMKALGRVYMKLDEPKDMRLKKESPGT